MANALTENSQSKPMSRFDGSSNGRLTLWFKRWRGPIQRWVVSQSLVPSSDVDDLAQEVFLRLLRYKDEGAVEYPKTYLFRIASNVASEWRERARNCRPHDDAWLEELRVEPGDEPETAIARVLIHDLVRTAVRGLPRRQRQVLMLHLEGGLTCLQIALQLGLTRRMVKRELAIAYRSLRWELTAEDMMG